MAFVQAFDNSPCAEICMGYYYSRIFIHKLLAGLTINLLESHGWRQFDICSGSSTISISFAVASSINSTMLWKSHPSKISTCGLAGPIFGKNVFSNHSTAMPCLVHPLFETLHVAPCGALWRSRSSIALSVFLLDRWPTCCQNSRPVVDLRFHRSANIF